MDFFIKSFVFVGLFVLPQFTYYFQAEPQEQEELRLRFIWFYGVIGAMLLWHYFGRKR